MYEFFLGLWSLVSQLTGASILLGEPRSIICDLVVCVGMCVMCEYAFALIFENI